MLYKKLYLYSNVDDEVPMPRFPNGQLKPLLSTNLLNWATTNFSRFHAYLEKDSTTDVYILKPKATAFLSPTPVF